MIGKTNRQTEITTLYLSTSLGTLLCLDIFVASYTQVDQLNLECLNQKYENSLGSHEFPNLKFEANR